MFTKGECTIGEKAYGVYVSHTKSRIEVLLIENNSVVSAYKMDSTGSYSFNTSKARDVAKWIQAGVKGCTRKNGQALPWDLGTLTEHNFTKSKVEYIVQIYRNELVGAYIGGDNIRIQVEYIQHLPFPQEIKYVKLTEIKKDLEYAEDDLDAVQVRTVEEIALEKEDVSWLKNKKYYIVNDDETAEKLFTFLDNYNGMISYDTETTGLKMNCFGKVGSKYEEDLRKYNEEHPDEKIRADKLVGIIFCVEPDVSYYFPCGNRKFKNLYEDKNSPVRKKIIERIRVHYTIGAGVNANMLGDMRKYITSTPDDELRLDVILMERVRNILENKHIVAHHGSFEWKVGWQYEIDTNLKDDTMLMHQIMYKFRSTTRNSGEPSNLKYLAKRELGIDQWDLKDFFPNLKEDKKGTVRERANSKNKGNRIDFSYMDYEGTRVYAPTDGDVTLQLCLKYKRDMMENHKELEFLYNVEMAVSAAVGYMEFYGHRLDESKILGAREDTRANIVMIEHDIRKEIGFNSVSEDIAYDELVALKDIIKAEKDQTKIDKELLPKLTEACMKLKAVIDADEEHMLNLSAPGQVADLFYNKLGYPMQGDKPSVAKKEIKGLLKEKDEEGNPKYKVAALYSKYKNEETLMTKFFDNLPYFMYPGGFIFSSYGQIATATGRMSCIEENTPILMPGGTKPIKDIKVGDKIYCYDKDKKLVIRKVLNVIDKGLKECVELGWKSTGSSHSGSLICTPDHKILTKDRGWVQAANLETGEAVYHARRSSEDRPRIYGTNGICEQEQLMIKREIFGCTDTNTCIHHGDENCRNNDLDNLQLLSRIEHSRKHANNAAALGKIKTEHLEQYNESVLRGKEHPRYKDVSVDELREMIITAKGIVTKVPMDFMTYKLKCAELGFDYIEIVNQFNPKRREIDTEEFLDAYFECNGTVYAIANKLNIGRVRVQNMINDLGLNDTDNLDCGLKKEVYTQLYFDCKGDLHKLAEVTGKNIKELQKLNTDWDLVYTGVSDSDFIDKFMECKGSVRAVARELNISFHKASKTIKRLNLCFNHRITSIKACGTKHVYDLEVEECHNFIANEICVHNCNKPNAQQYPKVITKIVVPREDYIMVDADYSQIEYRVLTALAKNEGLAELFSDPDSDYHTLMASMMYDVPYASVTPSMRSAAKSFNFGIPYGMGFGSLAILLTGKNTPQTRDEAKEKYDLYFKNQPRTKRFFEDVKEMAKVNKYTKTLFNRYRYYSFEDKDGKVNEGRKAAALRQAGNAVIQGCLHGDTLIQTKELGIVKIKDAVDTHLQVWDGDKWSNGDILYSGKKRKCIVRFSNGQEFICSPTHKFLVRSHKGNERFVECKDLLTKEKSKNPHRVVVNTKYEPSEHKYSSEWAYNYKSMSRNANNVFIDNMNSSFEAGMVLGRLASDGSVLDREVGGSCILQYVAEHELNVADKLIDYMKPLGVTYADNEVRDGRNEKVNRVHVYSKSLVREISELDIKHKVHDNIFMDTELLRGFVRGMFDGDGGISGKTISLIFGTQYDFEPMCRDLQKALAFFGIRSRYYKYDYRSKITIKTNDNAKFMEVIGFINDEKQRSGRELECIRDEHIFGQVIIPESVEITDEYIDMYDVCNTDGGYYVADGIITHNTAADIFKISVARNFNYIRKNKLLGLLLIINMVHDEQLMEINTKYINVERALADIGCNMQYDIPGFPPLFIGAGVGPAWGYAKGKMAEIHPVLLQNIMNNAINIPLLKEKPEANVAEMQKYMADKVVQFRRDKVAAYLADSSNWHKDIHPAIGGLINLQFNYGRGDDAKSYIGPNGETYSDTEFLMLNIADFLAENNIDAKPEYFQAQELVVDTEEDEGYDDEEEEIDEFETSSYDDIGVFSKVDESDKIFGSSLNDLISIFGCCVLESQKVCGFDVRGMHYRNKDALIDYIAEHQCDDDDPEGLEVVMLNDGNVLKHTGVYVKGLKASETEAEYKRFKHTTKFESVIDYKSGDIHNRSQA